MTPRPPLLRPRWRRPAARRVPVTSWQDSAWQPRVVVSVRALRLKPHLTHFKRQVSRNTQHATRFPLQQTIL